MIDLQATATKIRHSSAYAAGDRTTFRLMLTPGLELPGQSDPIAYMTTTQKALRFQLPPKARVIVIGAGYGGLASYLLNVGASHVTLVEPRFRFHAGLDMVAPILNQIYPTDEGATRTTKTWPRVSDVGAYGQFDLVICPEGFDECQDPVELLCALVALAKPGGACVVEVVHGETAEIPHGRVNSWRPTKATFRDFLDQAGLTDRWTECSGRGDNRTIYGITPGEVRRPEIPAKSYSEPMPRPREWDSETGTYKPVELPGLVLEPVPLTPPEPAPESAEPDELLYDTPTGEPPQDESTDESTAEVQAGLEASESAAEPVLDAPTIEELEAADADLADLAVDDEPIVVLPDQPEQSIESTESTEEAPKKRGRKRRSDKPPSET